LRLNPHEQIGDYSRALSAPHFFMIALTKEKRDRLWFVYLRLLMMSAAATAITTMTATPIVMYVAVGAALVGGTTTGLGVGATVATDDGVGFVAGIVGVAVGGGAVITTAGAAAVWAGPTPM
jgi:hypothetical protein